ncbi:MAG: hypothetical protein ACOCG5_05465, partial [Candidatus Alkaliphilus sp. MAG34]
GIILKYRSFAGQTNPARLRMTKMWGLHSNDKKREKCFFTQSDIGLPQIFRNGRPKVSSTILLYNVLRVFDCLPMGTILLCNSHRGEPTCSPKGDT